MNDLTDSQLLRRYAESRSEESFTFLASRHVDFVYSAALRMVRDSHLAEDVTQGVFVALAKNAGQLAERPVLAGWLHRTAQNIAAQTVRTIERRRAREQEAAAMNELPAAESDASWDDIAPQLDAALGELSEPDRDALLLRYFEKKSAREMAQTLGISEDAAQKRTNRAVDRLREIFSKQGFTLGASGFVALISVNAVQAAPVGLISAISAAVLVATQGTATALTSLKIMATTKMQSAITALVVAGAAITVMIQHSNQLALRERNESLQRQIAQLQTDNAKLSHRAENAGNFLKPRRPAPAMPTTTAIAVSPVDNFSSANLLSRVTQKPLHLTGEQVGKFLDENRRNASSLLAAYRTTTNSVYLDEAMQKFPDDPQVAFEAALRKSASTEEKRLWIDALKKSDADNPLGNYLSALECFNAGQADQAMDELITAAGKSHFDDYFLISLQANEEAYRAAGYSEVETRIAAAMGPALTFPQLASFKELSFKMVELAKSYRQFGDETSAQAALELAVRMGGHFEGSNGAAGKPPLFRAFGLALEANALEAMNPVGAFGSNGQTVQDRLEQIRREKSAIADLCQQLDALYPKATPQDMINFLDRARLFGDGAAMEWLKQKYVEK